MVKDFGARRLPSIWQALCLHFGLSPLSEAIHARHALMEVLLGRARPAALRHGGGGGGGGGGPHQQQQWQRRRAWRRRMAWAQQLRRACA